jgi:nucleoside-diphosphate-sugar epimerase
MSYTIGITGGSGYVGDHLARHLQKKYKIKILDVKPPSNDLKEKVEYVRCDIRDSDQVQESLVDVDLVIHVAVIQIPWINEKKQLNYQVIVTGTQNVCWTVDDAHAKRRLMA